VEAFDKVKNESIKLAARCRVKRKQLEDVKNDIKVSRVWRFSAHDKRLFFFSFVPNIRT